MSASPFPSRKTRATTIVSLVGGEIHAVIMRDEIYTHFPFSLSRVQFFTLNCCYILDKSKLYDKWRLILHVVNISRSKQTRTNCTSANCDERKWKLKEHIPPLARCISIRFKSRGRRIAADFFPSLGLQKAFKACFKKDRCPVIVARVNMSRAHPPTRPLPAFRLSRINRATPGGVPRG